MIAMQDRRISFDDLWLGLALDKEYGPGCEELLNKTLARHDLTTKNFPGPVNSLGCHNNLVRIWLGYEELPFYYCGKEQPVRFDLDNITPRTFLEENELPEIEVRRLDLACFLRERALPLPAPDVKDKTIWFHGEYASTEDNDSSFDPVLAEAVFKLNSLERDKRDCGIKAPQTITERKIQEGEIESIDAALSLLKRVLDAGSSITEEAKRYSRNRAHLAVLCLILPEGWSRDVENYQNDLHPSLSAVAQDAAYEWCRYYDIKKDLKKLEDEGQPGEWLQRRIRLLKKEKNAISLWMEDERDTPTTGEPEILEDYPSPFEKNCTSPTDSRGKKGNSRSSGKAPFQKMIEDLVRKHGNVSNIDIWNKLEDYDRDHDNLIEEISKINCVEDTKTATVRLVHPIKGNVYKPMKFSSFKNRVTKAKKTVNGSSSN